MREDTKPEKIPSLQVDRRFTGQAKQGLSKFRRIAIPKALARQSASTVRETLGYLCYSPFSWLVTSPGDMTLSRKMPGFPRATS